MGRNMIRALNTKLFYVLHILAKKSTARSERLNTTVFSKKKHLISTTLVVSIVTVTLPITTQAEVTPSLKNLLNSLLAGSVVLVIIAAAVSAVANFGNIDYNSLYIYTI